jgi:hypothetical protein
MVPTSTASRNATQPELNVWEFNRDSIEFYEGMGSETASGNMWQSLKLRLKGA